MVCEFVVDRIAYLPTDEKVEDELSLLVRDAEKFYKACLQAIAAGRLKPIETIRTEQNRNMS